MMRNNAAAVAETVRAARLHPKDREVGGRSRVKLLISAYACAPNRGSDYAVGWNWATEAHRLGHEI